MTKGRPGTWPTLADGTDGEIGQLVYRPHSRPARVTGVLDGGLVLAVESHAESSTWWASRTYSTPKGALEAERPRKINVLHGAQVIHEPHRLCDRTGAHPIDECPATERVP